MSLEAVIAGVKRDLNGLKGDIRQFGNSYILYDFAQGRIPSFLKDQTFPQEYSDFSKISELSHNRLDKTEVEYIGQLKILCGNLNAYKPELFAPLEKSELLKHCELETKKYVDLLRPLYKGYVDLNDPLCPASQKAYKEATWENWNDSIDPSRYVEAVRDMLRSVPKIASSDGKKTAVNIPLKFL